jgi:hypothetical protein
MHLPRLLSSRRCGRAPRKEAGLRTTVTCLGPNLRRFLICGRLLFLLLLKLEN